MRNRDTDPENKHRDTNGGRAFGGMNWEFGVDVYTLLILYIKQITNENQLYNLRNLLSALWWPKKEGNPKKGDICVHTTSLPAGVTGKEPNAEDLRDASSVPGSGRWPGGGHGNPPQYFCLENPMDRGAWRAPREVHRVAKSQTWLKWLSTRACTHNRFTLLFSRNTTL